jgi:predicted nuclease of predicted toxin-antitoxin system
MKILLDENVNHKLFFDFKEHQIETVDSMRWKGKTNGELLGLMTFNGFEVLITHDKNLKHQQSVSKFRITIIVLRGKNNQIETVQPLIGKVKKILQSKLPEGVIEIS